MLDIDLDAVADNWDRLCRQHPSGPAAAVLKADAYGLGAVPVARRLLAAGCRHVFTAHLSEARAIRPLLPPLPPGAVLAALNGLWPGDAPACAGTARRDRGLGHPRADARSRRCCTSTPG